MPSLPAASAEELERECRVFTRYLARAAPPPYVAEAYRRGHASIPCMRDDHPDRVDLMLLGVARTTPAGTRLADSYARFFRPTGILRQKLVLLCAVLENSPDCHAWFNSAATGGRLRIVSQLALAGAGAAVTLTAAVILLGPLHLLAKLGAGPPAPGEAA